MSKQQRLSLKQKQDIIRFLDEGVPRCDVAAQLGVAWKQVDYWNKNRARVIQLAEIGVLNIPQCRFESDHGYHYTYLLGCYLGDGYINKQGPYTWKMQVSCDIKYPGIINEISTALRDVCGNAAFVVSSRSSPQCVDVCIYSKMLPAYFPQLGAGYKHSRPIILEQWQRDVVMRYPHQFIKGMLHTDGSRYIQTVRDKKGRSRQYVKYNFTNTSRDIVDIFCWACDLVGLHYTRHTRQTKQPQDQTQYTGTSITTITFNKREDVMMLDSFVGPKS